MSHSDVRRIEALLWAVRIEAGRLARAVLQLEQRRRPPMRPRRRRRGPPRNFWTDEQRAQLRTIYPHRSTAAVARELGRSVSSINSQAGILGLHKTREYLAAACRLPEVGRATRFQEGHQPPNKGLRRPGWHRGRMRETQFKKGNKPQTWVPVGTEVVDSDGYRKRKVADDRTRQSRFNWKFVHVLVWENRHGKVPVGHAVAFKNGNRADLRIGNLELVSRRELMRRNTVHNLPKPLAEVIQLRGALMRQINRRTA